MNILSAIRATQEEQELSLLRKQWSNFDEVDLLLLSNDYLQNMRHKLGRSRNEVYAKLFRMSLVVMVAFAVAGVVDDGQLWDMVLTLALFASVINFVILGIVVIGMSRSITWATDTLQQRHAIWETGKY